jgi:hypothetical protein
MQPHYPTTENSTQLQHTNATPNVAQYAPGDRGTRRTSARLSRLIPTSLQSETVWPETRD